MWHSFFQKIIDVDITTSDSRSSRSDYPIANKHEKVPIAGVSPDIGNVGVAINMSNVVGFIVVLSEINGIACGIFSPEHGGKTLR